MAFDRWTFRFIAECTAWSLDTFNKFTFMKIVQKIVSAFTFTGLDHLISLVSGFAQLFRGFGWVRLVVLLRVIVIPPVDCFLLLPESRMAPEDCRCDQHSLFNTLLITAISLLFPL